MKTKAHVCVLLLLLALFALPAVGQNISSSVKGTLVDPAGGVVPNAKCTLSNEATGAALSATSAADGSFVFPNVLAGAYMLRVEATGFQALETKNIVVTASETRALTRLTLQLGEVRQTVSVAAEGAVVQLASSEKAGLVTEHQIQNIAVKGRDFYALLVTIPGVVDDGSQARETSTPDAQRGLFINGGRDNAKNLAIDGITDLDTGSNQTVHFQPNMDAIAEIKIMTTNYQAEFGRSGGGVITVITKSGSRDFHGTAYDYYRNETLNANSFFNNRSGIKKSPYRYRITGFSLGGPVEIPKVFNKLKDKLFFFWSEEWTGMKRDYGSQYTTMPTQAERNGDFSKSYDSNGRLFNIIDPQTGQQFPGNIIPAARINKLGQAILNFMPMPNWTDPDPNQVYRRNWRTSYSGTYPKREDLVRIDANLWPSFQVYWRWVRDKDEQVVPWGSWVTGGNWLISPTIFGQPGKGQVVHVTKVFSPTLVNEFTFGKSRNNLYFNPQDPTAIDRSKIGNSAQWYQDSGMPNYMPTVSFGGPRGSYPNIGFGNIPYQNWNDIYSFLDNIGKVWKSHNLKAGVYIERTGKFQVGGGNYRGNFSFSRDTNNPYDTGDGFSNALAGIVTSYSEATARVNGDWWFSNFEWYVQDNWKVNRRLTLDLGLRFYHMPPLVDLNQTCTTWDPTLWDPKQIPALYYPTYDAARKRVAMDPRTGTLAANPMIGLFVPGSGAFANGTAVGGKNGYTAGLYKNPWLGLGPRLGFAYDLFGNGKTAIRGGVGMFKDRTQGNMSFYTNGQPPVAFSPTLYYTTLDAYAQAGGAFGPSNMSVLYGKQKFPTTINFSLGIQREIWKTTIDLSYVGALSRHLVQQRNLNPIPMLARFAAANQDPTNPGKPLPDNFLRLYRGFGNLNIYEFASNSNYNALQLSIQRRFTRGLQFGIAYTHSKTLGVDDSDYNAVSPYFNPRKWNYMPLAFDRPNVFVANYVYQLPKVGTKLVGGSTSGIPVRAVLDNWQISGITSFQTGSPYSIGLGTTDGHEISGSTEGSRVTIIGDPKLDKSERTFYRWFNTGAFALTPVGSFGSGSQRYLYNPGINNWDIAVSKRVPLHGETRYVQFRTEMFNTWNHTQYSGVNTGTNFDPTGKQTNAMFGQVTGARGPRLIQLSLKLYF